MQRIMTIRQVDGYLFVIEYQDKTALYRSVIRETTTDECDLLRTVHSYFDMTDPHIS